MQSLVFPKLENKEKRRSTKASKVSKPTIALFLWVLFFVFHNSGLNSAKAIGKRNDSTNNALFSYPLTCIQLQPSSYPDSHQRLRAAITISCNNLLNGDALHHGPLQEQNNTNLRESGNSINYPIMTQSAYLPRCPRVNLVSKKYYNNQKRRPGSQHTECEQHIILGS